MLEREGYLTDSQSTLHSSHAGRSGNRYFNIALCSLVTVRHRCNASCLLKIFRNPIGNMYYSNKNQMTPCKVKMLLVLPCPLKINTPVFGSLLCQVLLAQYLQSVWLSLNALNYYLPHMPSVLGSAGNGGETKKRAVRKRVEHLTSQRPRYCSQD